MVKRKDRVYLPFGAAGLLRYGETEESKIKLSPKHVIYFSVGIGIFLILLKLLL